MRRGLVHRLPDCAVGKRLNRSLAGLGSRLVLAQQHVLDVVPAPTREKSTVKEIPAPFTATWDHTVSLAVVRQR